LSSEARRLADSATPSLNYEKRIVHQKILYPAKLSFECKGEIKMLTGKQKVMDYNQEETIL
jgi:hypothetical protein